MRYIDKLEEPEILKLNKAEWLAKYKANKSDTNRYRYRDTSIKTQLKSETSSKCVYCESKIGHNVSGDVEHMIPSSKNEDLHFEWNNLTIACPECNRRKNDYFDIDNEFLNPYVDHDLDTIVKHFGPIVTWQTGNTRAEITVRTLELSDYKRSELIVRKVEKIKEVETLLERYHQTDKESIKRILILQLKEMANAGSEFSGMIKALLNIKDVQIS